MKTKSASTWLALFLGSCLPAFGATEVLLYDGTFTTTTNDHGFRYFKTPLAAGTNWLTPANFYGGQFHIRYEVLDYPSAKPFQLSVCIWADVKRENGKWKEWRETCAQQVPISGKGVFTQQSTPSKWWCLNKQPVDFARVGDFEKLGLVVWSADGRNVSDWVPANQSRWGQAGDFLPLTVRVTIVGVANGSTFSGWERHLARSEYNASSATWPVGATNGPTPAFKFRHHLIHDNLPTVRLNGVPSLADYDGDGDLDMTVGSVQAGLFLLQNQGTQWVARSMGKVPFTSLGAAAVDVDQDGWMDLVSASVWYRNEREGRFSMHTYDPTFKGQQHIHDLAAADLNSDGRLDIVAAGDDSGFFWYDTRPRPGATWPRTVIDPDHLKNLPKVHGGFSPGGIGDLDGDGDPDIWLAKAWFENRDRGTAWIKHPVEFPELFRGKLPYGKSTRSVIIDIDRDGDNDIVFSECDDVDAKVGILENLQGNGTTWKLKLLPQTAPGRRCSLHALRVADFNQDGQLDIITVDQEDMMQNGIHSPRWYAFTQVGGEWKEQVLFDFGLGGHDIQIGDVDGDGDLDLVSKVWNPWKASANQGRSHADFLENLTIDRRTGRD